MTATRLEMISQPKTLTPQRRLDRGSSSLDGGDSLKRNLAERECHAREAAERGEIAESAKSILACLDLERRLASRGPQVLQLIKPRS